MTVSLFQGMEALEAKTEAHENEEKKEINDCDQQHLSQLDFKDLFCFYNCERIFWRFCVKLAVIASLQRTRTILQSMTAGFGSAIQSNTL